MGKRDAWPSILLNVWNLFVNSYRIQSNISHIETKKQEEKITKDLKTKNQKYPHKSYFKIILIRASKRSKSTN